MSNTTKRSTHYLTNTLTVECTWEYQPAEPDVGIMGDGYELTSCVAVGANVELPEEELCAALEFASFDRAVEHLAQEAGLNGW